MNANNLTKKIDSTVELVFQYKFNEVIKNTVEILEYIEKNINFSTEETKEIWKQIMQYLMIGLENKDHLIMGDILKYELKPLLEEKNLL